MKLILKPHKINNNFREQKKTKKLNSIEKILNQSNILYFLLTGFHFVYVSIRGTIEFDMVILPVVMSFVSIGIWNNGSRIKSKNYLIRKNLNLVIQIILTFIYLLLLTILITTNQRDRSSIFWFGLIFGISIFNLIFTYNGDKKIELWAKSPEFQKLMTDQLYNEVPESALQNLKNLFEISSRISLNDISGILKLDRSDIIQFLLTHKENLSDFTLDGDYLVLKSQNNTENFIELLDQQFNLWQSTKTNQSKKI